MRTRLAPMAVGVLASVTAAACADGGGKTGLDCSRAPVNKVELSPSTFLGLTAADLISREVGDYHWSARNDESESFPLDVNITSSAQDAELQEQPAGSPVCSSSLRLDATFTVQGQEVAGGWQGQLVAEAAPGSRTEVRLYGVGFPDRAQFTVLPEFATSASFGFSTTLRRTSPRRHQWGGRK